MPPAPFEELLPTTRRALLHRVAVAQAAGRTPSLVGAVMRDGAMVWSGARSMVDGHAPDADVQYRIGSITKTFIAVLVLRLRDEGLLDLADPLGKHLQSREGGDATIAQLLSHTAGLAAETGGPWWERTVGSLRPELDDVFGAQAQLHPVGRLLHYSNPGYALLGALVEQLRGAPWQEVLWREVLEPLGMSRTSTKPQAPAAGGFAVHPWADAMQPEVVVETGRMAPAGELWSTAADLCRYAAFLLDGDDRVLSAATLAEMRVPASGAEDAGSFGLGFQTFRGEGWSLFGHTGSMPGFLASLWVSPADRLAAVVLTNVTAGVPVAEVAADLVRITAEHEPLIPAPWKPLPEVDPELLALTGPWYWGPRPYILRLHADRVLSLTPHEAAGRASRFAPQGNDWVGLDGYYTGETLRAVRQDGLVTHLDLGSFVFTREPYDPAAPVPGGVDPQGWQGF